MTDEENDDILEMDDETYEAAESSSEDYAPEPVTARERLREQLANEVAEFLARGGKIDYIESNVLADPPRKPPCNYGGQPL
jgi:hypothetical protein